MAPNPKYVYLHNYIRSGKEYLSHFHPYEEEVYQSLVFLLHLAIRVSRVSLQKEKKRGKRKRSKAKNENLIGACRN